MKNRACYVCFKTGKCVIGDDIKDRKRRWQDRPSVRIMEPGNSRLFYSKNV